MNFNAIRMENICGLQDIFNRCDSLGILILPVGLVIGSGKTIWERNAMRSMVV